MLHMDALDDKRHFIIKQHTTLYTLDTLSIVRIIIHQFHGNHDMKFWNLVYCRLSIFRMFNNSLHNFGVLTA